jgi:hypothetical protein
MLWGLESNIFETFGFAPRKNKSVKEFVRFSTTDVFVPVSQLSTRDLFYFLENLKIKQDIFVLSFSSRSIIRTTSVMIPLFQILEQKMFKKILILGCLGCFTKSIVVSILDFWHISFRKMFELLTCKRNHNFESRASCKTIKIHYHGFGSFFKKLFLSFGVWREKPL